MPHVCPDTANTDVVISHHVDGELIARTMEYFGLGVIRGSTDKGGNQAVRHIIKALKAGRNVAITPDGPRGPRMCINSNIVAVAKITGAPIIPVTFSTHNGHLFNSWDRFLLPKPFGKGIIICGDPIMVPPDADAQVVENIKLSLESSLNTMNYEADMWAGLTPVLPENRNTPPKKRKVVA